MVQHISGTVAFFKAMAPVLIANVLTVTFVYCFAKTTTLIAPGRTGWGAMLVLSLTPQSRAS